MKSLTAEGNYDEAAEIADTINWHKIKNVNALMKAGEIYEKTGRYEESRDILLMAYDRSPIGRMIIYHLAEVAIKMGNYDEAKDYYQEFVEIAPHDNLKYVLKYEICKAQGSDIKTLIAILEELKDQEYSEEWAYELACLYHKAGMSEKCIEACDELILWFGDGPYVEKALELKMLYQPLTRQQEEKYREFKLRRDGIVEVRPEDELESGEIVSETVQIPDVKLSPERFNTQNLQEELQKSMLQIMEATEKETVDDSMDNIKKLVEDIPYLQLPKEEVQPEAQEEHPHIATDEEIDDTLRMNFQELLTEDYDGQMNLYVPDRGITEPQISGQMSIDEVLADWEKTRRAAAAALHEASQLKLESAKARALQEAGDIMDRLADVIPKLDSGLTPRDLLEEQYLAGQPMGDDRAAAMVANMNQILQKEIDRLSDENAQMDEQLAAAGMTADVQAETMAETTPEEPVTGGMQELFAEEQAGLAAESVSAAEVDADMAVADAVREMTTAGVREEQDGAEGDMREALGEAEADAMEELGKAVADARKELSGAESEADMREALGEAEALERESGFAARGEDGEAAARKEPGGAETEAETDAREETEAQEVSIDMEEALLAETERNLRDDVKKKASEDILPDIALPEDILPEISEPEEIASQKTIRQLSKEQRELFTYFVPIKGMEHQLCQALTGAMQRLEAGGGAVTGNMIIQGGQGSGKTVLATSVIKALQKETGKPKGPIGKIEATALNQKDIPTLLKKVSGGCLIIERAGGISKNTAVTLSKCMAEDKSGIFVIMEDTHRGIEKALGKDAGFASRFSEKINIPIFTSDELVAFAKSYANELGYTIDEMGVLALYNSISNIQKLDQATTLTEVKEIVDDAIARAERGGLKKAFSIITSRRYDDDDYVILHEKDFGF